LNVACTFLEEFCQNQKKCKKITKSYEKKLFLQPNYFFYLQMALFNSSASKEEKRTDDLSGNLNNIIAKGTSITGDLDAAGNIRFDGKIKGSIKCKAKVVTGKGSMIEGNIYAQNAEIEGDIVGVLEIAEILILKPTAVVQGDIRTGKLIVEAGAKFNGSCRMGEGNLTDKKVNINA
jgi:cytoskeletal protein CcmA (bactofilin family)